jgi:hypothetical protein
MLISAFFHGSEILNRFSMGAERIHGAWVAADQWARALNGQFKTAKGHGFDSSWVDGPLKNSGASVSCGALSRVTARRGAARWEALR